MSVNYAFFGKDGILHLIAEGDVAQQEADNGVYVETHVLGRANVPEVMTPERPQPIYVYRDEPTVGYLEYQREQGGRKVELKKYPAIAELVQRIGK